MTARPASTTSATNMIFFMGFSLLASICREEHPACGASSPWPRLTSAFGFGKAGRLAVCPLRFGIHWNALLSGRKIGPFPLKNRFHWRGEVRKWREMPPLRRKAFQWNALLSGTASADIAPFSPMLPLGVHAGAPAGPARAVP